MSSVELRIEQEYAAAMALRQGSGRKTLLVLCNSLAGLGLDFESVRLALDPQWDVRRLYIEDTGYFDWYYGLRHLYSSGARADVIAVALSARQLSADPVARGDYFAYRLMDSRDIAAVRRDLGLHLTEASNCFFASVSAFYGLRGEARKVLLGRIMPDLPVLMRSLTRSKPAPLIDEVVHRRAAERLRAYGRLVAAHNGRFMLIIPPVPGGEGTAAVASAAGEVQVPLVAVPSEIFQASEYSDSFHLNGDGARRFTAALIAELRRVLQCPSAHQSDASSLSSERPRTSL